MSKHNRRKKRKEHRNNDFSLVVKMNSRLLWRLFSLFLNLDIIFTLLFSFFIIYKAETGFTDIYQAAELSVSQSATGEETEFVPPELYAGYSWEQGSRPQGWQIPQAIISAANSVLSDSPRYFYLSSEPAEGVFENLTGLSYGIYNDGLILSYDIGKDFRLLAFILSVILVIEGLIFLSNISSGAKLIRSSLKPIYEIEQAARTLNDATSLSELTALTGRINKIEAQNLSSRLSVDSAQEELKGLSDAINDLLERIEEAYRSQARFVSDASHELRTPISVIQGYVNLLDRWGKNDPKTLQESIDAIKNEADNMKDLIEQLLFLARGDNEAMVIHPEVFNLALLVEEVYQESQMIDPNHEIIFKGSGSKINVEGDIQLIKQALRIFVDNSIKYTPGGEKITVAVTQIKDEARVTIQDNGIGMVPDDLPYIFDRFYRSDDSRARKTGGTGLGLSIAKWIVHRHGGHMEVMSRKDFGTRITVVLPLNKDEQTSSAEQPTSSPR